ncbi:hypothetical protein ACB092_11G112400 [Castanea dentata]
MLMDTLSCSFFFMLLMDHNIHTLSSFFFFFFFLQRHNKSTKRTQPFNLEPLLDTTRMELVLAWHLSSLAADFKLFQANRAGFIRLLRRHCHSRHSLDSRLRRPQLPMLLRRAVAECCRYCYDYIQDTGKSTSDFWIRHVRPG